MLVRSSIHGKHISPNYKFGLLTRVVYLDKLKNSVGGKGAPNTIVMYEMNDTGPVYGLSHETHITVYGSSQRCE